MYELKKNGKIFTSKFVGIGPSSHEKRIYRAAVSQKLRNTALESVRDKQMKRLVACIIMLQLHELYSHNGPFSVDYLLKPGRPFLKQKARLYCS